MLKLQEIKSFSEWEEEIDIHSVNDLYAIELESDGHKVICLDRSTVTIEQCETQLESPIHSSNDAIKVTVNADKDLSPNEPPHEIYISANRWGSSEVVLKIGNKKFTAKWIESDS